MCSSIIDNKGWGRICKRNVFADDEKDGKKSSSKPSLQLRVYSQKDGNGAEDPGFFTAQALAVDSNGKQKRFIVIEMPDASGTSFNDLAFTY